jgi:hypothetical protein
VLRLVTAYDRAAANLKICNNRFLRLLNANGSQTWLTPVTALGRQLHLKTRFR